MKRPENLMQISTTQPMRPLLPLVKALPAAPESRLSPPTTSVKTFVENVFIPTHVELKSAAGRMHYHAMLKHILTPESVEKLFSPHTTHTRGRLKARMNWPYLDNVRLCDLNADRVRQLVSCATLEGYSPQTVKHIRNVIGTIIKHAKRERVFSRDNPFCDVELPTMTRREHHDLTMEQAKTILKLMKYPEREVTLLTICTGLGLPEISALRWTQVNLTNVAVHKGERRIPARSIMIGKPLRPDRFGRVRSAPDKCVSISETLAATLMELRRRQQFEDPDGLLLPAPDGGPQCPLTRRSLQLSPIAKELQMPWLSWQVLRRAHHAFLEELRIILTDELVLSAFCQFPP